MEASKDKSYTQLRGDIVALLPPKFSKVLDVGCSNGALLEYLKARHGCSLAVGIEGDLRYAEIAKSRADEIYVCDLDNFDPQTIPWHFDLIVMADVIEHTKEPWRVLEKVLTLAEDGAHVIISVPNIQHWTAIKNLMLGVWPQRERGIFDKTHLRFFTYTSITSLLDAAGLTIVKQLRSYRIVDAPGGIINRFSRLFRFPLLSRFFTYQYGFLVARSNRFTK